MRVATQLGHQEPGATATVRQVFHFSNDPTLAVIAPPDQLNKEALRQAADGSEEVVRRVAIDYRGRPFIALASRESFVSSPIDGVTVLKQWSVRGAAGRQEIVIVLRREGNKVVVDSVR
jgi:hypothetical protein